MSQPLVDLPDRSRDRARHDAFARYVLPEIPLLLRVARTMTVETQDAEDLVQDVLLRAFRACDRFDGAYPRAWLLTILRNTDISRGRARRPSLLMDPGGHDDGRPGWPGATVPGSPEDVVVDAALDSMLTDVLAALPDMFRAVVLLVDVDGLSYAETARLLEIPEGTVMSRLHRARRRIRDHLTAAGVANKLGGRPR